MTNTILDDDIKNLFTKESKCIVNTDLDAPLLGTLLQEFLDWTVIEYSCCYGKSLDLINLILRVKSLTYMETLK